MAIEAATRATDLYYVASTARSKLGKEACRDSHRLRLLVGHANFLDHLMEELNQVNNGPGSHESNRAQGGYRQPEEIPELGDDSSSDDDSEDDLTEPFEETNDLLLVRCPVRCSPKVKPVPTVELQPQVRLNEAIHTAQRQHFSPSLDSVIENELDSTCKASHNSLSPPNTNAASHVVVDSMSKIALDVPPSVPSSTAKNSGGKQRSTARCPKPGRRDVCRKR